MIAFTALGFKAEDIANKCDPELVFCSPKIYTIIKRAQKIVAEDVQPDKKAWSNLLDAYTKWEASADSRDSEFAMVESDSESEQDEDEDSSLSSKGKGPGRPKGSKNKSSKASKKCVKGGCVGRPPKGGYLAKSQQLIALAKKYAAKAANEIKDD